MVLNVMQVLNLILSFCSDNFRVLEVMFLVALLASCNKYGFCIRQILPEV